MKADMADDAVHPSITYAITPMIGIVSDIDLSKQRIAGEPTMKRNSRNKRRKVTVERVVTTIDHPTKYLYILEAADDLEGMAMRGEIFTCDDSHVEAHAMLGFPMMKMAAEAAVSELTGLLGVAFEVTGPGKLQELIRGARAFALSMKERYDRVIEKTKTDPVFSKGALGYVSRRLRHHQQIAVAHAGFMRRPSNGAPNLPSPSPQAYLRRGKGR
ncbi:MAG: hypothetical protein KGI69_02900 [Patescibacteria group bacterium]|nr:hypothetical protein [Patescibacteria group bacterium]